MPLTFAFVSANEGGRLKSTDRKLIRSHCMIGKNANPQSRRHRAREKAAERRKRGQQAPDGGQYAISLAASPSDLMLAKFSGDLDGAARELLFKYYSDARRTAYPYELYVDFDYSRTNWFNWLYQDPAYLQSALLTASVIQDGAHGSPTSQRTYFYLKKTLLSLNYQLSNQSQTVPDSTVIVVLGLVIVANLLGDQDAVKTHVDGLQRIVRLRGGLEAFRHDTKLYMKLSRIELAHSLGTGVRFSFGARTVTWQAIYDSSLGSVSRSIQSENSGPSPPELAVSFLADPRLVACFHDLQHLAAAINSASPASRIPCATFQVVVCAIQSRLMALQGTLTDLLSECMRLGMLAFLTTTFQLPGNAVKYPYLEARLRVSCAAIETTPMTRVLVRWLLMVAAISVYGPKERWLRDRWHSDALEGEGHWELVRTRLCDVVWIGAIHDSDGQIAHEVLSS